MAAPLLHVDNLSIAFPHDASTRRILDRVSFDLSPGEVVGLVGESGSGKTMTALSIMGLLPRMARVEGGRIMFDGQDLLRLTNSALRIIRGAQIAMIFQNPRAALNPLMRVGDQVARVVKLHQPASHNEIHDTTLDLLQRVGISDATTWARAYPHQLSGGMAQRILIAMMLACQPRLLIADEPTTGLDVTIQAQIFELIRDIQAETGAALMLITHDLGVVSEVCQRVIVLYAGQVMEIAPVRDLFADPLNPYTRQLMRSILRVDRPTDLDTPSVLTPTGDSYDIAGCHFAHRCPDVHTPCWIVRPQPVAQAAEHTVICHKFTEQMP